MTISHEMLVELATAAAPHLDGHWRVNRLQAEERSSGWLKVAVITDTEQMGRALELRECGMQSGRVSTNAPGRFTARSRKSPSVPLEQAVP